VVAEAEAAIDPYSCGVMRSDQINHSNIGNMPGEEYAAACFVAFRQLHDATAPAFQPMLSRISDQMHRAVFQAQGARLPVPYYTVAARAHGKIADLEAALGVAQAELHQLRTDRSSLLAALQEDDGEEARARSLMTAATASHETLASSSERLRWDWDAQQLRRLRKEHDILTHQLHEARLANDGQGSYKYERQREELVETQHKLAQAMSALREVRAVCLAQDTEIAELNTELNFIRQNFAGALTKNPAAFHTPAAAPGARRRQKHSPPVPQWDSARASPVLRASELEVREVQRGLFGDKPAEAAEEAGPVGLFGYSSRATGGADVVPPPGWAASSVCGGVVRGL
jgi:hypothetical protein